MEKLIKVDGMSCGNCSKAVTERLMEMDGIDSVHVDLDSKEVKISGSEIDDSSVNEAIAEIGFQVI